MTVSYGRTTVLRDLSLAVPHGQFIALLGPSGSGKTTVLRTIAGFIRPDAGDVRLAGVDVTERPPHKRGIGVVFQSYALFPHMSVNDNLAYPLRAKGADKKLIARRCADLLELVRLPHVGKVRPTRLSGGQQQRIALARALAMEPELLLLDEPLSNLDANLRVDVGSEIRRLQQQTGTTAVMVTHDRKEAFAMADQIAVLVGGVIEQIGSPTDLYRRPVSRFMAEFVGDATFVPGTVRAVEDGVARVATPLGELLVPDPVVEAGAVDVVLRPEDIALVEDPARLSSSGAWTVHEAHVDQVSYFGSSIAVRASVGDLELSAVASGSTVALPAAGDSVRIGIDGSRCVLLPGEGPR
ncbi:ABC transporter ATP-binding protein [Nocardioides sp. GXZ039]|uniref:ABC transporter ATP-binding protein n=1 Tax=Nocardioides sp. GXZ039 TaxID=3136018 RepID=UPI0030F38E50